MPHDLNGNPLSKGDRVLVPCVVDEVYAGEDFCNIRLLTEHGRRPDGAKEVLSAINTGVVLKADPDSSPFAPAGAQAT